MWNSRPFNINLVKWIRHGRRRRPIKQAMSKRFPVIKVADVPRQFSKHIFICGLHRSGTTMLETLVHSHFGVSVLRAKVSENEGQHLQDVFPQAFEFGGPGQFAFHKEMRPEPPEPEAAAGYRERLLRLWTPWVVGDEDCLLEKSPPNLTKICWLREVFPGSRFIILTRDPRVVALATQKWSQTSVCELIFHWHVAHSIALEDMRDDCVHVRYEDLCSSPRATLDMISERFGLNKRSEQQDMPQRFSELRNSNEKYLESFPEVSLPHGVWRDFGYSLA